MFHFGGFVLSVFALLTLSALFSAAETAITAFSRARMHQLERDGDKIAKRVNKLLEVQERVVGALLLGNSVVNILASALVTDFLERELPRPFGVIVATVFMTFCVLVYAEVLPKTIALGRPDDVVRLLSRPTLITLRLFGPLIAAIQKIILMLFKLLGFQSVVKPNEAFAQEEIRGAIEYHHEEGFVEDRDHRMLGGVLDLAKMDVTQVMVHRKNIVMLDADLPTRTLVDEALKAPYTRMPLYRKNSDDIIGVLHARDLARAIDHCAGDMQKLDITKTAREPWFIPDTTNLKDQLQAFLKRKSHFALIVDEYGSLMGLVTLEDILEEIVGEIEDEHDFTIEGLKRQVDGSIHIDGSVTIRDLNRALGWNLPAEDWVTVAGLVIHEAQIIPEQGQTFIFHGHRFQILRRQRNQITAIRISPL